MSTPRSARTSIRIGNEDGLVNREFILTTNHYRQTMFLMVNIPDFDEDDETSDTSISTRLSDKAIVLLCIELLQFMNEKDKSLAERVGIELLGGPDKAPDLLRQIFLQESGLTQEADIPCRSGSSQHLNSPQESTTPADG